MTLLPDDEPAVQPNEEAARERLPETEAPAEEEELPRMTLLEHLDELRRRILRTLVVVFVAFFACFAFAEQIYEVLEVPIRPHVDKLAFLRITDPFIVYIKVALLAAIFLTSPYLVSQFWGFISPGLYRREKRYAIPFIFFGSFFFLAGGLFGYFIAFPFAVDFLINLGDNFQPVITIDFYLNTLINILLGLAVMFQLPIIIFMLSQLGVVTPRFLMRHFRWAVLIIVVISAAITPTPDVVNMTIVAGPTLLLYLLGVGAAALARRRKRSGDGAST